MIPYGGVSCHLFQCVVPSYVKKPTPESLTPRLVTDETIRLALRRLGVTWKRAKHWLTSPDPAYARKKNGATG
jgi:hypothetical protein